MAKKVRPPDPGPASATMPPFPGSSSAAAWRWSLVLIAVAAMGAGGAYFWHRQQLAKRMIAALPAMPPMAGRPAELKQRLTAASARVSADPEALDAVAELGRLYHASGYRPEAEACWRILRAKQPQEARWCYYLSDLRRAVADEEGLDTLLEQTVRLAPGYAPAWLELAELEFKRGRLDAAERAYRQRIGLVPDDPYAGLGLARIALQRGQRDEGRRQIEELIRRVPDFPSSHNIYAELLAQQGDTRGAANQRWLGTVAGRFRVAPDPWKEELRESCYDPDQLIVWGTIDKQTRHGDRGKALFERAIRIAPDDPHGYESLGTLFLDLGEAAKAREVLEQGSRLPQASEMLYVSLCDAWRALRQPGEALRVARQGMALMPGSALLDNARGLALEDAGRLEEALEAYRTTMARTPNSPEPVANLGVTLLRLGRRAEGEASLKQALAIQPMFSRALTTLARLELEAGRPQAAAPYIFPYFEQYPGFNAARELMAKYHLLLALEAVRGGDAAGAERACRDGLAIVPGAAELYGFLGVLCAQQRRMPEAVEALETAHRLLPTDIRVALSLSQLYFQLGRLDEARRLLTEGEQLARQRGETASADQIAGLLRKLPP